LHHPFSNFEHRAVTGGSTVKSGDFRSPWL
jgi:hypothetical protein